MLTVFGIVAIPTEPQLKTTEVKNGFYLNFQVVSWDDKKQTHRYGANLYVPANELDEWKNKIEPGNVFMISGGKWAMKENPNFNYPLPQLNLDRFTTRKLVNPLWLETEE